MNVEIQDTLKAWRLAVGLTQVQAAGALGLSVDRYRHIEQGSRKPNGDESLRIRDVIRNTNLKGGMR